MSNLVLITGGSGLIGSRVIIDTLQAGYFVRAAVRSQEKADRILALPAIRALDSGSALSFIIVPDMLVKGAYEEAIKEVTQVIHLASPLLMAHKDGDDYQKSLVEPAVKGTMNMLEAAKKEGSVKRIVITSSIIAIVSLRDFMSGKSAGTTFTGKSRASTVPEPYESVFEAYSAGKTAALNDAEAWMETEKANIAFDVVHLFPAFVLGQDETARNAADALASTNKMVLGPVTGHEVGYTPGVAVHVRDVARAHVKSLDPGVPGNEGYLLSSDGINGIRWEDQFDIVKRQFSDAVAAGTLPNNGKIMTAPVLCDASASEDALGFKFTSFEQQVKDVIIQYLELVAASG